MTRVDARRTSKSVVASSLLGDARVICGEESFLSRNVVAVLLLGEGDKEVEVTV